MTFSLIFPPSKPTIIPPSLFQTHNFFLDCYHVHLCVYTYILILKCVNTTFSVPMLFVMGLYDFKADHLVLENQPVCLSLGQMISPAPSIPLMSAVLRTGQGLLHPSTFSWPALACLLASSLFSSCFGSHVGETSLL